jgi:hypothetical protein
MKRIFLLLAIAAFASSTQAQSVKDEMAYIQQIWGKEKKTLVGEALKLNTEEANKFWPIYEEYQKGRNKFMETRVKNITNYADAFANMTDGAAKDIVSTGLKNGKDLNKLQEKTFKKMSKAVSPIRAAQFLQLETYIDSQISATLFDELPFMPNPKG